MFAPVGYTPLKSVFKSLFAEYLKSEHRLGFPSRNHLEIDHLAYLAQQFGEYDYFEDVVFSAAQEKGLLAFSPKTGLLKVASNPLDFTMVSALELFDRDDLELQVDEKIDFGISNEIDDAIAKGSDPWTAARQEQFRVLPMCFTRTTYTVNLDTYREYIRRLLDTRWDPGRVVYLGLDRHVQSAWEQIEGFSLCVPDTLAKKLNWEYLKKEIQIAVFSSIWDNGEEIIEEVLMKNRKIEFNVNNETRAFQKGLNLLRDEDFLFTTQEDLFEQIGIELGARAKGRVVAKLREKYPRISKPGRKS